MGIFGIVVIVLLLLFLVVFMVDRDRSLQTKNDDPRRSPFTAVRWNDSEPEVQVGDEWLTLVSLDDIPVAEIVAFSQQSYGDLWRKRFEEDLVELLTRMGHPPGDTVTLVVRPEESSDTQVLEDVPMTAANRQAIKAAADARTVSKP